jgi:hypothetical protein
MKNGRGKMESEGAGAGFFFSPPLFFFFFFSAFFALK